MHMFIMQILVGVKFVRSWPFLGRVRLCFVEPPYFQMTVKPLIGHGLDVTEFPGISGWLVILLYHNFRFSNVSEFVFYWSLGPLEFFQDKLMDTAFGQTLVEVRFLWTLAEGCSLYIFSLLMQLFFFQPNMLVIDVEKFVSTPSGRRKLCFLLVFKESSFHSCCFPFNPPLFCVSFQQL